MLSLSIIMKMVMDFQEGKISSLALVNINKVDIEIVGSYQYQDVQLNRNLDQKNNLQSLYGKTEQSPSAKEIWLHF